LAPSAHERCSTVRRRGRGGDGERGEDASDGSSLVAVNGDLRLLQERDFRRDMQPLHRREVTLDLAHVRTLSREGCALLREAGDAAVKAGGWLQIAPPSTEIAREALIRTGTTAHPSLEILPA
jgi:hypothetical protein